MILTGTEIHKEITAGRITFAPFEESNINPNSMNYRLGPQLKVYRSTRGVNEHVFEDVELPEDGYTLLPGRLYLGHTLERIGSDVYAMSLIGRSSIGRLGLFVQLSANLGHTTSCHQWTLELVASHPIRIYPRMRIGQVSFWRNKGEIPRYSGWYARQDAPAASRFADDSVAHV